VTVWSGAVQARLAGDGRLLFDGGGWLSAGDLGRRAERLAQVLRRSDKALVFAFMANRTASVVGYLASVLADHAVALLDAGLPADRAAALIAAYAPDFILTEAGPVTDAIPAPWQVLAVDEPGLVLFARPGGGGAIHPDLAVLLSTSGSTGSPKFVRLSGAAIRHNAAAIADRLAIGAGEVALAHLPLHYSYGMSVLNSHLLAGAAVAVTGEPIVGDAFWQVARAAGATSLAGVPYHYDALRRLDLDRLDVPTLVTLTQAGGRAPDRLIEWLHGLMARRGGRCFVMYGQTEASPRMTTLPAEALPAKLGSVGPALPGGRIEIVDPVDQSPLPSGTVGEVVYHGPNVMMGYATSRADLARGDECGQRLRTGDRGSLDADGCLFLAGRAGRIGKVMGTRVDLDQVETLLDGFGRVAAVEVDERLMVTLTGASTETMAAAKQALLARVAVPAAAVRIRTLDSLPLTASGKIDYPALKALS